MYLPNWNNVWLKHKVYVLQSKEAGADDILDISGCELSEVGGNMLLTLHLSCFLKPATLMRL